MDAPHAERLNDQSDPRGVIVFIPQQVDRRGSGSIPGRKIGVFAFGEEGEGGVAAPDMVAGSDSRLGNDLLAGEGEGVEVGLRIGGIIGRGEFFGAGEGEQEREQRKLVWAAGPGAGDGLLEGGEKVRRKRSPAEDQARGGGGRLGFEKG